MGTEGQVFSKKVSCQSDEAYDCLLRELSSHMTILRVHGGGYMSV